VNLKYGERELFGTNIVGATASMGQIEDKTIEMGRFLAPHEIGHAALVCVIGGDVKNQFFRGVDPLGKVLKIRNTPFMIVGVEAMRGPAFGQSIDNHVYIPISTWGKTVRPRPRHSTSWQCSHRRVPQGDNRRSPDGHAEPSQADGQG
jgi:putative ABC transport system permease protein